MVKNECALLKGKGHRVYLYTRNNTDIDKTGPLGKLCLPFVHIFNPRTYLEIKKIIREKKIDVVHVHNTLNLISPAVYYAAAHSNTPVVQTLHNFRLICPGALLYREGRTCEDCIKRGIGCSVLHGCYRNSRLQTLVCVLGVGVHGITGIYRKLNYICLSGFNRDKLLQADKRGRKFRPDRMFVKPNFVIPPEVTGAQRSGYIYAGRLEASKGIKVLLKAWRILGDKAPELKIYGSGPEEEWCGRYISEHGLNAKLMGLLGHEEIFKAMADSRAMIMPTLWYEGCPMSIIESISVKTPVICSDIGNPAALVTEGKSGLKFRCSDAKDLAQKVEMMEQAPFEADESCAAEFSAEKNYEKLMEIYESSIKRCNSKKRSTH